VRNAKRAHGTYAKNKVALIFHYFFFYSLFSTNSFKSIIYLIHDKSEENKQPRDPFHLQLNYSLLE